MGVQKTESLFKTMRVCSVAFKFTCLKAGMKRSTYSRKNKLPLRVVS